MKLDLAGVSVMLAMPAHRDIPPQTVASLLSTQEVLLRRGVQSTLEIQAGGSLVHHARTKCAWHFLQGEFTHLFWIDSDMSWKAEDFLRLLAIGTKLECVGATYAKRSDPPQIYLGIDSESTYETNEFGCIPVSGMGLGFTVVQRTVIQQLADQAEHVEFPDVEEGPIPYIFECGKRNGRAQGEDMAFFSDVRELGYKVWLDPSITLGHIGQKEYRASIADHLMPAQTTN